MYNKHWKIGRKCSNGKRKKGEGREKEKKERKRIGVKNEKIFINKEWKKS